MLASCRNIILSLRRFSSHAQIAAFAIDNPNTYKESRQVWIENFNTPKQKKLGLLDLHPEVFGTQPRVDIIYENIEWQRKYRFVSFATAKTRAEVHGGGRKPWPQKGLGRARHGSIRSPLFRGGGVAHGPRSPKSHFYMLPFSVRVLGLTSVLSVKLAQDDLHVVDDLIVPTNDSSFIKDLISERGWGPSVLIVDESDIFPEEISLATDEISYVNLMPLYGLNVYSMLKHDTLVLTAKAAKTLEDKLLYQLNRADGYALHSKFKLNQM